MAAKWIQIRGYESSGHALPPDLQAWKAKAIQKRTAGGRLAEWKARVLENLGDEDSVLGRRLRLGQTQDEARAAIMQMTAAELKAEAEVASREGALIGRLIIHGKLREDACRTVVRMSKEGRIGIAISHLVRVHGHDTAPEQRWKARAGRPALCMTLPSPSSSRWHAAQPHAVHAAGGKERPRQV
jgi:hypothetical protein